MGLDPSHSLLISQKDSQLLGLPYSFHARLTQKEYTTNLETSQRDIKGKKVSFLAPFWDPLEHCRIQPGEDERYNAVARAREEIEGGPEGPPWCTFKSR